MEIVVFMPHGSVKVLFVCLFAFVRTQAMSGTFSGLPSRAEHSPQAEQDEILVSPSVSCKTGFHFIQGTAGTHKLHSA